MARTGNDVWLIRHGETEWSANGRHTSVTDLPLTVNGLREATALPGRLAHSELPFALVLTSPRIRARDTCVLAGLIDQAEVDEDLVEWNYGEYEGLRTKEIRADRHGWLLWRDGCPGGESAAEVGARVDRVIDRARAVPASEGPVALFAHGHVLRVLGARWLGLEPSEGRFLALSTASVSILGHEHEWPALWTWNDVSHLRRRPPPTP